MGCDIHAFVEIKIEGKWHTYNQVDVIRNYVLFGCLGGVRGLSKHIKPRGLPSDVATVTSFEHDRWGVDAHSTSWLTIPELHEAVRKYAEISFDDFGEESRVYSYGNVSREFSYAGGEALIPWSYEGKYSSLDSNYAHAVIGYDFLRVVFWFDS